jgi:tight adherence protein C
VTALAWLVPALVGGVVLLLAAGCTRRASLAWPSFHSNGHGRPEAGMVGRASGSLVRLGSTRIAGRLGRVESVERRLELNGRPMTTEAFRGLQVLVGVVGLALTVPLGAMFWPALAAAPLAAMAGVRVPEMILARRARRRQDRIAAAVPDLAEVLLATTEAGLSPTVALERTADVIRGPLGDEVRAVVAEVHLGVPWHRAMQGLTARTDVGALNALIAAVERSQRLGSELGVTLRRVADDLRGDRRSRAEEAARKAPLKMLFPLVFLILPAFLLLTVGPVVLATLRSLR